MTARDRIRAAECEGCAKGIDRQPHGHGCEYMHYSDWGAVEPFRPAVPDGPCTAPSDEQIIERLAGEVKSLKDQIHCAVIDKACAQGDAGALKTNLSRIAVALSLPPEAGVEEIVTKAKEAAFALMMLGPEADAARRQG